LAANQPEDLKGIEETLRAVVPTFVKLRVPNEQITYWETEEVRIGDDVLPRRTKRQAWGHRLELEFRGLGFVPAALASEGTILALAVLSARDSCFSTTWRRHFIQPPSGSSCAVCVAFSSPSRSCSCS
jgi:hypothetical protein